jgi:hypothetical protein
VLTRSVNCFITCIAINLMLTICFSLNPLRLGASRRQRLIRAQAAGSDLGPSHEVSNRLTAAGLERWYIGLSLLLAFGQPAIPAGLGHFGYDPVYDSW